MAPTILGTLSNKNQDVTKILVSVRPAGLRAPEGGAHDKRARLSATTVHHFEALSGELQDSPLKSALERLAARQKNYLK
jgi:hypothetical protein